MHIAICDDDARDLDITSSLVKEYAKSHNVQFTCFSYAKDLFESSLQTSYDIILLDIEMPEPNGFEIAKKLIEFEHKPLIIFITNSMEYTLRGYGIAFRYIPKPLSFDTINDVLDAAISEVQANRFMFNVDGNSHILPMEDIYFLEAYGHSIILHTLDTEYEFRDTLKNILIQLPSGYFGTPHQSYVVNFKHIKTATTTDIHLTNGAKIPISRRRAGEFQDTFHKYLGR